MPNEKMRDFWIREVTFLVHLNFKNGVFVDWKKNEKIKDWLWPTNIIEERRILLTVHKEISYDLRSINASYPQRDQIHLATVWFGNIPE